MFAKIPLSSLINAPGGIAGVNQSGYLSSKIFGAASVRDFGAVGDGVADDSGPIQAAIDWCVQTITSEGGTLGGGCASLFFPRGVYRTTKRIAVAGLNGFRLYGECAQSSQIIFDSIDSALFGVTTYLNLVVDDMTLLSGSVEVSNGLPFFSGDPLKSKTCFDFDSQQSGTMFTQNRCVMAYWKCVYKTTSSTVNGDNHAHNNCTYQHNSCIWDNTNTQAVIWSFNECKAYFNQDCFVNPASTLRIVGGDWINRGDFLKGALSSTTTDIVLDSLRFESYQNIDAESTPRLFNFGSGSGTITLRNCTQRGGGSLNGKESGAIAGLWDIKLSRCWFGGIWNVSVNTSLNGVTGRIVFEECDSVPEVNQSLQAGQGNRPLNLEYRRHRVGLTGNVDRVFSGGLSLQSAPIAGGYLSDVWRIEGAVNGNSIVKSCPVFVVSPYVLRLKSVSLGWVNNTPAVCTVRVWSDNQKTTLLASIDTFSKSGIYQVLTTNVILGDCDIVAESSPLFVEVSCSGNAGVCRANIELSFVQVD